MPNAQEIYDALHAMPSIRLLVWFVAPVLNIVGVLVAFWSIRRTVKQQRAQRFQDHLQQAVAVALAQQQGRPVAGGGAS
ncbi:MAG: hypothetical protein F4112_15945 [Holophagales bacterium]|nr:hypothetical protein [Holophagales bacterium]MYB20868.1 hypothetical protein [Holophagales bacterium]MYD21130.1 hypothetical protein [Holophagales bacterium]MYH25509.1 hypothetical protein [Holophagales bacterium]MYI34441.1 hypothetical protein [Holophagales bacterium]